MRTHNIIGESQLPYNMWASKKCYADLCTMNWSILRFVWKYTQSVYFHPGVQLDIPLPIGHGMFSETNSSASIRYSFLSSAVVYGNLGFFLLWWLFHSSLFRIWLMFRLSFSYRDPALSSYSMLVDLSSSHIFGSWTI